MQNGKEEERMKLLPLRRLGGGSWGWKVSGNEGEGRMKKGGRRKVVEG